MRILVIEDDPEASSYLVKAFGEAGHAADVAPDGLQGYAMAQGGQYEVLVVDRMLPKLDGLSLIGGLRAQKVETPVLILSALGQVDDRVKGLRAGGDDYLPKPYSFSELLARVEILARRKPLDSGEPTLYRVGSLELDRLAHKVSRNGKDIPVQPREFRLLEIFDAQCRAGRHPDHAARACVGLSLRSADQRHRRPHLTASLEDRPGVGGAAAPYGAGRRVHDP